MHTELKEPQLNPQTTPSAIIMKWGLIGGLTSIIFGLALFYMADGDILKINRTIQIGSGVLITISATFLAMKERRDLLQEGYITFGKAYSTGLLTSCVILVLTSIFSYVTIFHLIDFDQVLGSIIDETLKTLKEKGSSDEEIKRTMGYVQGMTPTSFLIWGLLQSVLFHLVINLITAAIAKKNPPQF